MKTTRFLSSATVATLTALAIFAPRDASAAGTALDVQSGRGTGMASAMTAMTDDSASIFYNPAGIAQGKKLDVQAGITLISPAFNYTSPGGDKTSLKFDVVTPFNVYAAGGITDNLSVGVGVFTPFGLRLAWPDGWAGRRQITSASLSTFYVNPTVAYKLGPLRIGAGFQLVRATIELKKDIGFGDQIGNIDIGGATWGVGGNVGLQLEAIKQYLSLGVHYRSAVKLSFDDGDAHFGGVPRALQGTIHDQKVTSSVIQPDTLAMGVASRPIKDLVIDVDAVWLNWSWFKSLDINFPNDASGSLSTKQAKNWTNTVNLHVGAEGILSDHWMLRGGVLYDPSPSPADTLTPDIPDATRVNLAVGGTWKHDTGIHVDAGYQFIILTGKTSTAPQFQGDYGGFVNILGLSVGYTTPPEKHAMNTAPPDTYVTPTPEPLPPGPSSPLEGAPPASSSPSPSPTTPAPSPGL